MPPTNLLDYILQHGLGPVYAIDNPHVYPFILAALAISVFAGIIHCIRYRALSSVVSQAIVVVIDALIIYGIWLAYSTPFDRLPFGPPTMGSYWLFLPADSAYMVLALIAHGVLSVVFTFSLILI